MCWIPDSRRDWHINASDYPVQQRGRYFTREVRCTRCRQFGHLEKDCPRVPHCHLCSQTGHTVRYMCPDNCCFRVSKKHYHNSIFLNYNCSDHIKWAHRLWNSVLRVWHKNLANPSYKIWIRRLMDKNDLSSQRNLPYLLLSFSTAAQCLYLYHLSKYTGLVWTK